MLVNGLFKGIYEHLDWHPFGIKAAASESLISLKSNRFVDDVHAIIFSSDRSSLWYVVDKRYSG
jgi:hypothetical protein